MILILAVVFNLSMIVISRGDGLLASWLDRWGLRVSARDVPLGVSFFSLALISYLVDLRARRTGPARGFLEFSTWVSLFPKIVAGPIVRYRELADDLADPRVSLAGLSEGAERFIVGLAKKLLLADTLAPVPDEIFSLPAADLSAGAAWLGTVCFALQLYFDFSGYSDMAIGLGRMFGFRFVENFNYPYAATSLGGFWRRWHISLTSWLRDYLFLPLAYRLSRGIRADRILGIRSELWIYGAATLTTMVVCGLWHRVSWGCVIWGAWHGAWLIVENSRQGRGRLRRLGRWPRILVTQWIVLMGWVFFRAASAGEGSRILLTLYGGGSAPGAGRVSALDYLGRPVLLALLIGLPLCTPWLRDLARRALDGSFAGPRRGAGFRRLAAYGRVAALMALFVAAAMALAAGTFSPFVYQQF